MAQFDQIGITIVGKSRRKRRTNLADMAYDQLEELIVTCALRPGDYLSIQDLQEMIGGSRTPVHQAVARLAADTLIVIRPRHGLRIAPLDLDRERTLLPLRRDMERFVVRLATERAAPAHRLALQSIARALRADADRMSIDAFNLLDRRMDHLLNDAAGEPFLADTLRPLHTIFRRIGWIYHRWLRPEESLAKTVGSHLAILDAVVAGHAAEAVTASDRLLAFSDSMFDVIGPVIDPNLFDSIRQAAD
jgi:DNA-binding GntR family transcriptional regulator